MTDHDKTRDNRTAPQDSGKGPPAEIDRKEEVVHRERREAASSLLSPAVPPAGAGAMLDVDPRLDDRSETEQALERAKGTPD
jgi:hypothetical protein